MRYTYWTEDDSDPLYWRQKGEKGGLQVLTDYGWDESIYHTYDNLVKHVYTGIREIPESEVPQ